MKFPMMFIVSVISLAAPVVFANSTNDRETMIREAFGSVPAKFAEFHVGDSQLREGDRLHGVGSILVTPKNPDFIMYVSTSIVMNGAVKPLSTEVSGQLFRFSTPPLEAGDVVANIEILLVNEKRYTAIGKKIEDIDRQVEELDQIIENGGGRSFQEIKDRLLALKSDLVTEQVNQVQWVQSISTVIIEPLPSSTTMVDETGGTIGLPGLAALTIPSGSLESSTEIAMSQAMGRDFESSVESLGVMFDISTRVPYEIKVDIAASDFSGTLTLDLAIPQEFLDGLAPNEEVRAISREISGSEYGEEVSIDLVEGVIMPGNIYRILLSYDNFVQSNAGTQELVVSLVATDTVRESAFARGPAPLILNDQNDMCLGDYLDAFPVSGKTADDIRSGFMRSRTFRGRTRPHKGIDIPAAVGTPILSVRSGVVVRAWTKDQGNGSFGNYVIVRHATSTSLYAHMSDAGFAPIKQRFEAEGEFSVAAGEKIGEVGNTGISNGPHLHFELTASCREHFSCGKINPQPCFEEPTSSSITVFDNGSAADDSFSLSFDGRVLGQTTIGGLGRFGISNIRPGNYTIRVTGLVVPDGVGTYGVSLNDGVTFENGSTSASGTVDSGESRSYTIIVPAATPNPIWIENPVPKSLFLY